VARLLAVTSVGSGRGGGEGVRTRDHLANLRTFLAWFRIGVLLMGLGYALRMVEDGPVPRASNSQDGSAMGITGVGMAVIALAAWDFARQRRAIEQSVYQPRPGLHLALVGVVAATGLGLIVFLLAA
jgi:putative membrane protein